MAGAEPALDIAIVGGGLVGASLALALSRRQQKSAQAGGLRIALIESFPLSRRRQGGAEATDRSRSEALKLGSFDTRATALSQSSIRCFTELGLWPSLEPFAAPIRQVHVSEKGSWSRTVLDSRDQGGDDLGQVVLNSALGQVLLQHLQGQCGLELLAPLSIKALKPIAEGYELLSDSGRTLQARLVILADGGQSGLADSLGIQVRCKDYGQTAIVANVETGAETAGVAYERFLPGGAMALLPIVAYGDQPRHGLVWTQPHAEAERLLALSDADLDRELKAAMGGRLTKIRVKGKRAAYPVLQKQASEVVRPGLLLLGNAAHTLHPVAGQGFNLSVRDLDSLARYLSSLPSDQIGEFSLLQRWHQGRRKDQAGIAMACDSLIEIFGTPHPLLRQGRRLGLSLLETFKPLRQRLARLGTEGISE